MLTTQTTEYDPTHITTGNQATPAPPGPILLTTLNARYHHAALGLRYLLANLKEWRPHARMVEFVCTDAPEEIAETILNHTPCIVAIGVYIWNVATTTRLVRLLKRIQPEIVVVLGGPEVSFETEKQSIVQEADYTLCGEGERLFYQLCCAILSGNRPDQTIFRQVTPLSLSTVAFPYNEYQPHDIAHRTLYVELSRGCPYHCAFCLSAVDPQVRRFPLEPFLKQMQSLLARGVRHFKFVDRTFNLNSSDCIRVLDFFLQQKRPDLFLHFEMVPDRVSDTLKTWIQRFPAGMLQFEVGIQTFNPEVQARIQRRQNIPRTEANLAWLSRHTTVHLHTDLIVGLPGETLASFASGFDRLAALNPHEIQVGILKRLRGAPILAQTETFGMVYNPDPPYDLICNAALDFMTMRRLKRFARFWDLFGNSGRFPHFRRHLFQQPSPFDAFLTLSDWLYAAIGRTHNIALRKQFEWLYRGLIEGLAWNQQVVWAALEQDFLQSTLREPPDMLRGIGTHTQKSARTHNDRSRPVRQARHHRGEVSLGRCSKSHR